MFSFLFHINCKVFSVGPLHMNYTNPAFTVLLTGHQFTNIWHYFTNSLSINKYLQMFCPQFGGLALRLQKKRRLFYQTRNDIPYILLEGAHRQNYSIPQHFINIKKLRWTATFCFTRYVLCNSGTM